MLRVESENHQACVGSIKNVKTLVYKMCVLIVLAVVFVFAFPAEGLMVAVPLENRIAASHLIVTGEIVEVSDDIKEKMEIGGKSYKTYHRLAYIKVEEVLKNDLTNFTIKPGDKVEIMIGATAKRAKKLAKQLAKNPRVMDVGSGFSREKGDRGIWLLWQSDKGLNPEASYDLMDMLMLDEFKGVLGRLEAEYQAALKNEIPRYAEKRKEILSIPAVTQAMADAAMGRPIPPKVELSDVYVMSYYGHKYQALFIRPDGKVLGGVPYCASGQVFSEGFLPVATAVDGRISKYNFIDRNGQLLCERFYTNAGSFSQGRALVSRGKYSGYIDTTGKEVIPCIYKYAESFSGGMAKVIKKGSNGDVSFIDERGQDVDHVPSEISERDRVGKIKLYDKQGNMVDRSTLSRVRKFSDGMAAFENKKGMWGFIDKEGKVVFPATASYVDDFSDGVAAVEVNVWVNRRWYSHQADLSENAPKHVLFTRWGCINKKGEMVIDPLFDSVGPFQNGLAKVIFTMGWAKPAQTGDLKG